MCYKGKWECESFKRTESGTEILVDERTVYSQAGVLCYVSRKDIVPDMKM